MADFWPRAEALQEHYDRRVRPELTGKNAPTHLTIAAFAHISMLMKLGALLEDKLETTSLDLPTNGCGMHGRTVKLRSISSRFRKNFLGGGGCHQHIQSRDTSETRHAPCRVPSRSTEKGYLSERKHTCSSFGDSSMHF